jgi:flagellar protein FlaI
LKHELNKYTQVASTLQAFINDPETILTLIANDKLENSLSALQQMDSVLFDITEEAEARAGRPSPSEEMKQKCEDILDEYEHILKQYEGQKADIEDALDSTSPETPLQNPSDDISDNLTVVADNDEISNEEILRTADEEITEFEEEQLSDKNNKSTERNDTENDETVESSQNERPTNKDSEDEDNSDEDSKEENWEPVTDVSNEEDETDDSTDDEESDVFFGDEDSDESDFEL